MEMITLVLVWYLSKLLYIRNCSRWEISAKMKLGRSPIVAISRTLNEGV